MGGWAAFGASFAGVAVAGALGLTAERFSAARSSAASVAPSTAPRWGSRPVARRQEQGHWRRHGEGTRRCDHRPRRAPLGASSGSRTERVRPRFDREDAAGPDAGRRRRRSTRVRRSGVEAATGTDHAGQRLGRDDDKVGTPSSAGPSRCRCSPTRPRRPPGSPRLDRRPGTGWWTCWPGPGLLAVLDSRFQDSLHTRESTSVPRLRQGESPGARGRAGGAAGTRHAGCRTVGQPKPSRKWRSSSSNQ